LLVDTVPDVLALPQAAVLIGQEGAFVFVVRPDRTVEARPVTVARTVEGTSFVIRGLASGERVVTDNQLRLAHGSAVSIEDAPATTSARGGGA
jgi:multidrug efflux system membrane fusion protein